MIFLCVKLSSRMLASLTQSFQDKPEHPAISQEQKKDPYISIQISIFTYIQFVWPFNYRNTKDSFKNTNITEKYNKARTDLKSQSKYFSY